MKKIISVDAETNGLWGKAFAIAAILYTQETDDAAWVEVDRIVVRLPDNFIKNQWVKDNCLPRMKGIKVTHYSYPKMLSTFANWYNDNRKDTVVLWHMGHVVEAFLFREMVDFAFIGEWDAPYTPIEVAEVLRCHGEDPASVDTYLKKKGVVISDVEGGTHNPIYDCIAAMTAYIELTTK